MIEIKTGDIVRSKKIAIIVESINGDRYAGTQLKNTAELMVPNRVNTIYKNEIIEITRGDLND